MAGIFPQIRGIEFAAQEMLRVATRVAAAPARRSAAKPTEEIAEAHDLLLRGQCNDAYWHGVFGGLYAPHLRTALWKNLIHAELLADRNAAGGLVSRVNCWTTTRTERTNFCSRRWSAGVAEAVRWRDAGGAGFPAGVGDAD